MTITAGFAASVRAPGPVFGTWMGTPHPIIAETISQTGLDFVIADGEHGAVSPHALLEILPAADRYSMPIVYRVAYNRPEYIRAAFDSGVAGVLVPMVNSAEQAAAAVAAAKYPPHGSRGMGAWRASNYYQDGANYIVRADDETVVILQVETVEAVRNVNAIAAVPGIDVLYLGPGDLALSQGVEPGLLHPSLLESYKTVVSAARQNGIKTGIDVASIDIVC